MSHIRTVFEGWQSDDLFAVQDVVDTGDGARARVLGKQKVDGGIRQVIFWPRKVQGADWAGPAVRDALSGWGEDPDSLVPERVTRALVAAVDHISRRPFRPGDRCDGTKDRCVTACLLGALMAHGAIEGYENEVGRSYQDRTRRTRKIARWEGVVLPSEEPEEYPEGWTEDAVKALCTSLRSHNRRSEEEGLQNVLGIATRRKTGP